MEGIQAFFILKLVEIGPLLGLFGIIAGGLFLIVGICKGIQLIIEKLYKGYINWELVGNILGTTFIVGVILTWLIVNCVASRAVVKKWHEVPEANKWKVAFNHAWEEDKQKEEK